MSSTQNGPEPRYIIHHPGDAWDVRAELSVGASLSIELHPAGGYRWSAVESSDPETAGASCTVDEHGVARCVVSAFQTGVVTLTATTVHTGDRFGPPTRRWSLTLDVGPHL